MSEKTAPFLLLKLRTCDDFDIWSQPTGKVGMYLDMTVAYEPGYAKLRPLSRIEVTIAGYARSFSVLSVEPAYEGLNALVFRPTVAPTAAEASLDSIAKAWVGSVSSLVDAQSELARDIAELGAFLERRQTTQSLAYGAAGRTGN